MGELPMLQQRLATCVVVTEDMGMEGMVDTVDMEDMDTMERDLLKLKLSQDTSEEDMEAMVMAVDTMARGRLKLSQDILEDMVVMVMDVDMVVMDMDVGIMARGRLMLNQDILEDMVVMAVVTDMEAMAMVDMAIMVKF